MTSCPPELDKNCKYVVIGKKPHILLTTNTGLPAFIHAGVLVIYDETRDGPMLDTVAANNEYPEWAI